MGTPEFPDLGKHCSVDGCKLIDFLPFTCDRCKMHLRFFRKFWYKDPVDCHELTECVDYVANRELLGIHLVFCLQHRNYTTHLCPNANEKDVMVLICPLCAKGVRLVPNQDPNITWDVHVNNDCDPSNYQKASKKKRCPVPGCKEQLTFSNKIKCRDCTQEHCLKHRFGSDHRCPGPKKPDSGFPFVGLLKRSQTAQPKFASSSGGSSRWSSSLLSAASSVKASAESGMQMLSTATNQALQRAKDGMAQSRIGDGTVEHCPQCPAILSSVTALIEHVEKSHNKGAHQRRVTADVCPKCRKAFWDPVLLVEHVERDHRGTSKA